MLLKSKQHSVSVGKIAVLAIGPGSITFPKACSTNIAPTRTGKVHQQHSLSSRNLLAVLAKF